MNPITLQDVGRTADSLAAALDCAVEFEADYVVLGDHERDAVALWVAHTYVMDAFDCTPYLSVESPERECGKTRLLELAAVLVHRPWSVSDVSAAALFRKIAAHKPTLLLDEVDAIFGGKSEYFEALRGVLNAGNRRGCSVARCVGEGAKQKVVDFPVFGPKVLAGIDRGTLPETIVGRSVMIEMRRKTREERVRRWRQARGARQAESIRDAFGEWARDAVDGLRRFEMDLTELSDRMAEAWEPLLAVADAAGGDWPERAKAAAIGLSGGQRQESSRGVKVLAAMRAAMDGRPAIGTAEVLEALNSDEELPFGRWNEGKGIDARGLAGLLRPYKTREGAPIKPKQVRVGEDTRKGYRLDDLDDAFSRYLPPPPEKGNMVIHGKQTPSPGAGDVSHVPDVSLFQGREAGRPEENDDGREAREEQDG